MSNTIKLNIDAKGLNEIKEQAKKVSDLACQLEHELKKLSEVECEIKLMPDESQE